MRQSLRILPLALLVFLAAAGQASADTLIVEGLEQARASSADRPPRGMTMKAVAAKWGEPTGKAAAVGQPPITRWDYNGFAVFFEYDHVIHAVVQH